MRNDEVFRGITLDKVAKHCAIFVRQLKAVFLEQRLDAVVELDQRLGENMLDLGLSHFELAQSIEVDLVDRTAGTDEANEHPGSMPLYEPDLNLELQHGYPYRLL